MPENDQNIEPIEPIQEGSGAGDNSLSLLNNIDTQVREIVFLRSEMDNVATVLEAMSSDMMSRQADSDEAALLMVEAEKAAREAQFALRDAVSVESAAAEEANRAEALFEQIKAALIDARRDLADATAKKLEAERVATSSQVAAHVAKSEMRRRALTAERDGARLRAAYALHEEKLLDAKLRLESSKVTLLQSGTLPGEKVQYLLGVGADV